MERVMFFSLQFSKISINRKDSVCLSEICSQCLLNVCLSKLVTFIKLTVVSSNSAPSRPNKSIWSYGLTEESYRERIHAFLILVWALRFLNDKVKLSYNSVTTHKSSWTQNIWLIQQFLGDVDSRNEFCL